MTNNEMIDTLIGNQNAKSNTDINSVLSEENQDLISKKRVLNTRNKIYTIGLLLLIILLIMNFLLPSWDKYQVKKNDLNNLKLQVMSFETKRKQMESDKQLIQDINKQENKIISCLNNKIGCEDILPSIKTNFGIARSYISLNNFSGGKMAIDEKKLLANINEYLLKSCGNNSDKNGSINKISFLDSINYLGKLNYVPIRLNITFEDKNGLSCFINNAEKNILVDQSYRILYKIDEIAYDIVNYETQQNVDINMFAYYYQE
ncbi:MAG: hypothetical protein WC872_03745 [Candidatus Absconditabacterales bacterium]